MDSYIRRLAAPTTSSRATCAHTCASHLHTTPPVPRRDQRPDHCCALASADRPGLRELREAATRASRQRSSRPLVLASLPASSPPQKRARSPSGSPGRPLIKSPCQRCGTVITKVRPARWCARTCRDADYNERRRASRSRNPPRARQPARIRPHDGATCGLYGAPLNRANLLAGAHKNAARPPMANAAELTAKRNTPPGSAP